MNCFIHLMDKMLTINLRALRGNIKMLNLRDSKT